MINSPPASAASDKVRALIFMLCATVLLASMHGMVRFIGSDLHPFVIVFFRNLFGLIAVLPLLYRAGIKSLHTRSPRIHLARAIVGAAAMACWFTALTQVPLSHATALSFSTTLFAALCASIFLKEKMRTRRWIAIIVGFIGVFIALRPDTDGFNQYTILVLCSALAWGASVTIVRLLSRTESVTTIVGWMSISLTILSFPTALLYWETPTGSQFLILGFIGMLATGGHLMMTRALQLAETSIVMSVDFTRLIWTAIIGALLFGEVLDLWTLIGAIVIFSAGWYIIFRESRVRDSA